jgi:hypothetical protein
MQSLGKHSQLQLLRQSLQLLDELSHDELDELEYTLGHLLELELEQDPKLELKLELELEQELELP